MINIIGIGPGSVDLLTFKASNVLKESLCIIGTDRQLDILKDIDHKATLMRYSGNLDELYEILVDSLAKYSEISLLASGDPNFYGISEWVKRSFLGIIINSYSGISSVQALFSALGLPMHNVYLTSVHGREPDWTLWMTLERIGILTDQIWTPQAIAKKILEMGYNPRMHIGEKLTYKDQCLTSCFASEVPNKKYEMCVVVIENER